MDTMPLDLGRWLDNDIIYGYETRNKGENKVTLQWQLSRRVSHFSKKSNYK